MKPILKYLGVAALFLVCNAGLAAQNVPLTDDDKKILADLETRAKRYVELRETLRRKLPKVSKDATAAEIAEQKAALQRSVQAARVNAVKGNMFSQSAEALVRSIIKKEFKGYDGAEIRQTVLEADTKGIPLKVNVAYPVSKELVEMSPALLLALPQLPKELRYRYIGRSLVILDRDNALILDFMRDALP
jgi:hypothetical protein